MTRRHAMPKRGSHPSSKRRQARKSRPAKNPPSPPQPVEKLSALGRKLLKIRKRIVASGQPLLDWDGVDRELAERRGQR